MNDYNKIVKWYSENRSSIVGVYEVLNLIDTFRKKLKVLDLGCGNGFPIGISIYEHGHELFGVDESELMLNEFKKNIPAARTQLSKIEAFKTKEKFDIVISWGVLFHLDFNQQKELLTNIYLYIKKGGWLLFTSGEETGKVSNTMDVEEFEYYSLGKNEYIALLEKNGMKYHRSYYDDYQNYIYEFTKT